MLLANYHKLPLSVCANNPTIMSTCQSFLSGVIRLTHWYITSFILMNLCTHRGLHKCILFIEYKGKKKIAIIKNGNGKQMKLDRHGD